MFLILYVFLEPRSIETRYICLFKIIFEKVYFYHLLHNFTKLRKLILLWRFNTYSIIFRLNCFRQNFRFVRNLLLLLVVEKYPVSREEKQRLAVLYILPRLFLIILCSPQRFVLQQLHMTGFLMTLISHMLQKYCYTFTKFPGYQYFSHIRKASKKLFSNGFQRALNCF